MSGGMMYLSAMQWPLIAGDMVVTIACQPPNRNNQHVTLQWASILYLELQCIDPPNECDR